MPSCLGKTLREVVAGLLLVLNLPVFGIGSVFFGLTLEAPVYLCASLTAICGACLMCGRSLPIERILSVRRSADRDGVARDGTVTSKNEA